MMASPKASSIDAPEHEGCDDTFGGSYDSSDLSALTMRSYRPAQPGSATAALTTFALWGNNDWEDGYPDNYLPVTAIVEIRDASGDMIGRIEAEYVVSFYTTREVKDDERERVLGQILPDFWRDADRFLSEALNELGYESTLIQEALLGSSES